ncbi:PREDICTED: wall-associated receptor kinase-like 14 [Nelumbo nucifera]|uniref:Wall-associated receptor kinase-like 14 n=1 Tax=Nelumbo nucifera TaxID=4432 RepID=A0A1U8AE56_NELNU|nr:PREDICTED: wall-associated receptor kinase-like 14 [Nelumbo nucifera]
MIFHHQNPVLYLVICLLPLIATQPLPRCNQTCGFRGREKRFPYPFGFSDGCPIRLNCIRGVAFIGQFRVENVTADSIFINLPARCNRPIQDLRQLFNGTFALTKQNGLLLENCSSLVSMCTIPTTLLENHFDLQHCDRRERNLSCFAKEDMDFMTFNDLKRANCKFLFSSVAVDSNKNSSLSLEFQTVQLGWWLEECNCSLNANNKIVQLRNNGTGCLCHCKDGFEGDGFQAGSGCRRATSNCNPSKYMKGRCGGTTRVGVLIGGIIAGASLVAGLVLLCYFVQRRSTSLKTRKRTQRLLSEAAGVCSVPFYPYKEIERATNGFSDKQRLGTGAYGTVYAGKLHSDEWVAIKKIRHRDNDGMEQVMNEIKLLSSVSHPHLVRLLGFCIERGEQILVYEFMPNGTLSEHLQRERGNGLPWTIRLTIACETAQAIAHLHSAINPPIYHRDIKSSNILLDYNFNSKVADFGLSRLGLMESSHISTAPQGTPGYVDPQYHQNFHLSDKSDVYSFGVVLVEIITALKVVDFSRPHNEVNLAALAVEKIGKGCVDEIIDPFLEPHRDAWTLSSVHKVAELAFRCLAFHRDMRPSMKEVATELENIRLSGWITMEENICMESSSVLSSSCSSSSSNMSEKSHSHGTVDKNVGLENQRSVVPQRGEFVISTEMKDSYSPVSVQDPWFSEQSSPSSSSLLGNAIQ